MEIDPARLAENELKNLVENHRRKDATDPKTHPAYIAALEELARRKGNGLDFATSRRVILEAARKRQFLSYKDLADASGSDWQKVHWSIGSHLFDLVEWSWRQHGIMLSAIVVNKENIDTGDMEPGTLKGFCEAGRALGLAVTDETAFLKEQQRRVFDWARGPEADEAAL